MVTTHFKDGQNFDKYFKSEINYVCLKLLITEVNYTDEGMKKSRNSVITQLGGTWLFLENCQNHNKYFPDLIEQSIEAWQELNEAEDAPERKPVKEFSKPKLEKMNENYYFIAG